jgi:hypothetical protein
VAASAAYSWSGDGSRGDPAVVGEHGREEGAVDGATAARGTRHLGDRVEDAVELLLSGEGARLTACRA